MVERVVAEPRHLGARDTFYLDRLVRFSGMAQSATDGALADTITVAGAYLLKSVTFSAFRDCVGLGLEAEARRILHPEPTEPLDIQS